MHGAVTGFGSSTTALPYRLSSLCVSLHIRSCSKYSSGATPLAFGGTLRIKAAPCPYLRVN